MPILIVYLTDFEANLKWSNIRLIVYLAHNGDKDNIHGGGNKSVNGEDDSNSVDSSDDEETEEFLKSFTELTTDDIREMSFNTMEDAVMFYEKYAQCKGFT